MRNCLGLIMSYDTDINLRFFTENLIKAYGGVVDDRGRVLDAVLPGNLADELSVPEYLRLQFDDEGEGDLKIHYGSTLLDKMVAAARGRVPVTGCALQFEYLKTAGFDRLVRESLYLSNAVGKVGKTAATLSEYFLSYCTYLAQSDEQKEGLLTFIYNRNTMVDVSAMADGLAGVAMEYTDEAVPVALADKEIERIEQLVQKSARRVLATELQDFEASMNRRYRRDVENLNEYYTALGLEMEKNLQRSGLSERLVADRQEKIALIPAELAAKTDDLFKKYSIRIRLKLSGAMLLKSPVVKIFFHVSAGRNKKTITLTYNPVLKSVEPLPCRKCGTGTRKLFFDRQMNILCPQCN